MEVGTVLTKKDLINFLTDMDKQSTIDSFESYKVRNRLTKLINDGCTTDRLSFYDDLADKIMEEYGKISKVEILE